MAKRKQGERRFPELGVIATTHYDREWNEWSVVHQAMVDGRPAGEKLGEYFACDREDACSHAASVCVAVMALGSAALELGSFAEEVAA